MKKVIKFSTTTCGPCITYSPIFNKVSSQFPDVQFESLDATQNTDLVSKYGIKGVPTTIFLYDDHVVDKVVGVIQEQNLIAKIKSL